MITTSEALDAFLVPLRQAVRVALDTEADSLHCYFEKLCLVQISIPGHDVLIDPLAGFSLQPLFEELPRHELILHDLDYDLRILRRSGLAEVGTVFDTMLAARLTGCLEFGLAPLLLKHFGVVVPKASQKADWARRPLSAQLEDYARNDTRHLAALAALLEAELHRLGRWDWFVQSCEKGRDGTLNKRERDPDGLWRITGSDALHGREAALLRGLWGWRDAEARQVDRPPFHILRNEQLIEAARRLATGATVEIPHLTGRRRQAFLEAAATAQALPSEAWPERRAPSSRVRLTPEQERRVTELKRERDLAATQLQIDPTLIAPKSVLEALAAEPAVAAPKLLPWQRQLLGLNGASQSS